MKMNEVYSKLSERTGLTKKDSENAIKELVKIVEEEVRAGGTVSILGFATFACKEVEERTYSNPKTKEGVIKPAHREMKVKVSSNLKDI